ncbi:hypothetical protein [Streptomyces sp. NPDC019507]|uniref:hypothetical protein n=1 Tax=Streptomyces sp. NPDC019507 TaxID=3154689 RepID=UPI0033DC1891
MPTRGNAAVERLLQGMGLHEALGATNPDAWLELDAEGRVIRPPVSQSRDRARVRALALCHRDGRVREAALEQVAGAPELLPLLVIRTADWARAGPDAGPGAAPRPAGRGGAGGAGAPHRADVAAGTP